MSATSAGKRAVRKFERNDRLMRRHAWRATAWQVGLGLVIGGVAIPVAYGYGFYGSMRGMSFAGIEQARADAPSVQYPEMLASGADRALLQPLGATALFDLQRPDGNATQAVYEIAEGDGPAMLAETRAFWTDAGLRTWTEGNIVHGVDDNDPDRTYAASILADKGVLVVSSMMAHGDEQDVDLARLHLPPLPADAELKFMGSIAGGFSVSYGLWAEPEAAFDEVAQALAARGWRRLESAGQAGFVALSEGVFQRGPSRLTVSADYDNNDETIVSLVVF